MCVYLYIIIIHENNMFKRYQLVPRATAVIKNRHLFIGTTEYIILNRIIRQASIDTNIV